VSCVRLAIVAALAMLAVPETAKATFPGANGKIAFSGNSGIEVVNPDGSGHATLAGGPNGNPTWSSDGQRIAFTSSRDGNSEIYVMNADGTGQQRLTTNSVGDGSPTWSPDGTRIGFARGDDIWSMRSDGTDQVNLTNTSAYDCCPAWSPDGTLIAYDDGFLTVQLMRPDGTSFNSLDYGLEPTWSPNGREVWAGYDWYDDVEEVGYEYIWYLPVRTGGGSGNYFASYGHVDQPVVSPDNTQFVYAPQPGYGSSLGIMIRAGANRLLNIDGRDPDWQPIPADTPSTFARPKGATPVYLSLVPDQRKCSSATSSHGPPLAYGSCRVSNLPPANATVGTPDANGKPANSIGFLQYYVQTGTPGGPDDSDVLIAFSFKSVYLYRYPDVSDYTDGLEVRTNLQITDKQAGVASTGVDFPLSFAAPCVATVDPNTGGNCAVQTSADAIRPGLVPEGQRSNWEVGQAEVYDAGDDGNVATIPGNRLFATQGVFVP
jgi:dipeptidyl aminopeptidase/acylaminoacyl peptidase